MHTATLAEATPAQVRGLGQRPAARPMHRLPGMSDFIVVLVTVGFFAAAILYVRALERM